MKNTALSYEVSFSSALWMVFPESWKRSCPNFYSHDCKYFEKNTYYLFTSSPDGAIFRYSLTSLELSKTLTLVKSTAVYERTLSGMITEKEIKKISN